jgi:hypothetical protein
MLSSLHLKECQINAKASGDELLNADDERLTSTVSLTAIACCLVVC